jgi:hypothetical protein
MTGGKLSLFDVVYAIADLTNQVKHAWVGREAR